MTIKQQHAAIKAQNKAQLEISKAVEKEKGIRADNEFRRNARSSALSTAQFIEKGADVSNVIQTADLLYQWLIKVLK